MSRQEALAEQVGGYPRTFLSVGDGGTVSGTDYLLLQSSKGKVWAKTLVQHLHQRYIGMLGLPKAQHWWEPLEITENTHCSLILLTVTAGKGACGRTEGEIRYVPCLKLLNYLHTLPDMPSLLVQSPCHFLQAFLLPLSRAEPIPCDNHVWDSWDLVSSVLCRISHWAMPSLTRGSLSGVSGAPPLQTTRTTLNCTHFYLRV